MKIITKEIQRAIEKQTYGSQDGKKGEAKVIARLFGGGSYTAYILEGGHLFEGEWDGHTVYGLVKIFDEFEYGTFDLDEVMSVRFPPFGLGVERDLSVEPCKMTLEECWKHESAPKPWEY